MFIRLFVNYDDIEKYNNGEEIIATDLDGKSSIFNYNHNVQDVLINTTEIVEKQIHQSRGFVHGDFNKFIIKKEQD